MKPAAVLLAVAAVAAAGVAALSPAVTGGSPACVYQAGGALPDPACTPGATNKAVTQQTIGRTICTVGWTATIRPPVSVTAPEKLTSMRQYGDGTDTSAYEYDHLISLELGGAPNDTSNLWPEPHVVASGQGSYAKDAVENGLKAMICKGTATLAAAQYWIAHDWRQILVGQPLPAIPSTSTTTAATTAATPTTTAAATTTSTKPRTACQRWPRRHWLHHVYHAVCRADYFTTP